MKRYVVAEHQQVSEGFGKYEILTYDNGHYIVFEDNIKTLSKAKSLAYEYEDSDFRHTNERYEYYVRDTKTGKIYLPAYASKEDHVFDYSLEIRKED